MTLLQAHIRLMLNSNEEDYRRLDKLMRRMVTELVEKANTNEIGEFPGLLVEVFTSFAKDFEARMGSCEGTYTGGDIALVVPA